MNWAWWDGKMKLHHYRDEHGLGRARDPLKWQPSAELRLAPEAESETGAVKHGKRARSHRLSWSLRHGSRMLLRNPISLAGMALALVSLANIFLFVIIDADRCEAEPLYRHPGLHGLARIF